jgi:hypothetical protein
MNALTNEIGSLDVMALYPDGLARERVMSVLHRIHDKLWPAIQFEVSWGKFEHLEDPMVRRALEAAVTKADILCFATRNQAELPAAMKQWLSGIQYPHGDRPLVALLDISNTSQDEKRHVTSFLEDFAKTHRMDFLPYYTADVGANNAAHSLVVSSAPHIIKPVPRQEWLYPPNPSSLNE